MFFCECCEIFKNTYFEEDLRMAASEPKTIENRELNESQKLSIHIFVYHEYIKQIWKLIKTHSPTQRLSFLINLIIIKF